MDLTTFFAVFQPIKFWRKLVLILTSTFIQNFNFLLHFSQEQLFLFTKTNVGNVPSAFYLSFKINNKVNLLRVIQMVLRTKSPHFAQHRHWSRCRLLTIKLIFGLSVTTLAKYILICLYSDELFSVEPE